MRKFITIMLALCLMAMPAMSLAESQTGENHNADVYDWISDNEFDMYELGIVITLPDGWTKVDQATINDMNGLNVDPQAAPTAEPAYVTALEPYTVAIIGNADNSVKTVISSDIIEDPAAGMTADNYLQLLANDMVASGAVDGLTYTYDPTSISDATLSGQNFREMLVSGSDGSVIDLLVCVTGMNSIYTFAIMGTTDSITTFAPEFVNSISEMESVG